MVGAVGIEPSSPLQTRKLSYSFLVLTKTKKTTETPNRGTPQVHGRYAQTFKIDQSDSHGDPDWSGRHEEEKR
jgi:hypothetical protein